MKKTKIKESAAQFYVEHLLGKENARKIHTSLIKSKAYHTIEVSPTLKMGVYFYQAQYGWYGFCRVWVDKTPYQEIGIDYPMRTTLEEFVWSVLAYVLGPHDTRGCIVFKPGMVKRIKHTYPEAHHGSNKEGT